MDAERLELLRGILIARRQSSPRSLARALRRGPPSMAWVASVYDKASHEVRRRTDIQLAIMARLGLHWLPPWQWPTRLAQVQEGAIGLFVRGDRRSLFRPSMGIVGSRRACAEAARWSSNVAARLCDQGYQVVSGGARGIDAAAHRGALGAGGLTLVFVGVSCDRLYPARHRQLFRRILETGGAIATEHPPGEGGRPFDHAARNRFIAAAVEALFVAEAGERSGSLITARHAFDLARPVWFSPIGVARSRSGFVELEARGARVIDPFFFGIDGSNPLPGERGDDYV